MTQYINFCVDRVVNTYRQSFTEIYCWVRQGSYPLVTGVTLWLRELRNYPAKEDEG